MKRPSFQFYPADWRKDAALQSCSLAAQGMWMNLLCIAHECEPYGNLTINGLPMSAAQIGRLVGLNAKDAQALLTELTSAAVVSSNSQGVLFSRRMVRDEQLRNVRAECGRLGGNPALVGNKDNQEVKQNVHPQVNQPIKQSTTPSSSSSSSASTNTEPIGSVGGKPPRASRKCPVLFVEPENAQVWVDEHCPGVDWRRETAKFRDHTFKTAISDWLGAWRNWMRKAAEFAAPSKGEPQWAKDRKAAVAAYGGAPRRPGEIIDMENPNAARTKLG